MPVATSRSADTSRQGWREYSLYGVNRHDRVARCEHFMAPSMQEAILRAEAQIPRYHKVEIWDRSTCVFEALRSGRDPRAPRNAFRRLLAWMSGRRIPIPIR